MKRIISTLGAAMTMRNAMAQDTGTAQPDDLQTLIGFAVLGGILVGCGILTFACRFIQRRCGAAADARLRNHIEREHGRPLVAPGEATPLTELPHRDRRSCCYRLFHAKSEGTACMDAKVTAIEVACTPTELCCNRSVHF